MLLLLRLLFVFLFSYIFSLFCIIVIITTIHPSIHKLCPSMDYIYYPKYWKEYYQGKAFFSLVHEGTGPPQKQHYSHVLLYTSPVRAPILQVYCERCWCASDVIPFKQIFILFISLIFLTPLLCQSHVLTADFISETGLLTTVPTFK